jgi:hydroxypyruvate isomerase
MPRFCANISMMFKEVPFLARFEKAKAAGFRGVECLIDWQQHAPEAISEELKKHDLGLVLFNLPPGDLAKGEIGLAALPGREQDFTESLDLAAEYARVCQVRAAVV